MRTVTGLRDRLDRAAVALGAGAAASLLLSIAERAPLRLFSLGAVGVVVMLVLAAAALIGGYLHLRPVVILAGAGFAAAVVLQVVQASLGGTNTLGGDGSSVALHLGFAVGLLTVGLAPTTSSSRPTGRQ
ncbi:hypothetical protein [Kribbella catacumbae]|uniref:Rv1678 family membrane protein n=1 Tax=Kribbella catacumbae TaxID=460086 RepID=UPI00039DE036|nr:hypothetical protein [Kribbella catacumbae]